MRGRDSTVRVTVLGCSGTHVGPSRACSSYLVSAGGYRLLLDCGNGSLQNLQRVCGVADVDAVLLSHLHPDHFADLYSLYYALRFDPSAPRGVPVHAPAGAAEHIAQLLGDDRVFREVFAFPPTRAGDVLHLGPLRVALHPANHPVETLASRVEVDGRVIAYSADSAASPDLVECARDADLFIADCTWREQDRPLPEGVHMTGREAGEHAERAGAARLLVTHVQPINDADEVAAEAAEAYGGEVLVAHDLMEIAL